MAKQILFPIFLSIAQLTLLINCESANSFEVCNLDLAEKNPAIVEHFSDYCKSLLSNQHALEESKLFAQFKDALNRLEIKRDPTFIPGNLEGQIPDKLWKFREQLYRQHDYFDCKKPNSNRDD